MNTSVGRGLEVGVSPSVLRCWGSEVQAARKQRETKGGWSRGLKRRVGGQAEQGVGRSQEARGTGPSPRSRGGELSGRQTGRGQHPPCLITPEPQRTQ